MADTDRPWPDTPKPFEGEQPMAEATSDQISPETAEALYESRDGEQVDGWTRVTEDAGQQGSWMQHHTLVIRDAAGQHYGIGYEIGLTEEQPAEFPWGTPGDPGTQPIGLVPLYPHEVTIIKWRTTPATTEV